MKEIVLHVDVGREQGWGHLQETLNIADKIKARNLEYKFLINKNSIAKKYVKSLNHKVQYLSKPHHDFSNKIVISNLVKINHSYANLMKKLSLLWAVITEHKSDELGNVNFNISKKPKYFPLNEIFITNKSFNYKKKIKKILISFGGSDPKNVTLLTLELIRQSVERGDFKKDITLEIILGNLFIYKDAIKLVASNFPLKCNIHFAIKQSKLKKIALKCDISITTGGGTMYEFCALGIPSIIIPILDKMKSNAKPFKKSNAIILLKRSDKLCAESLNSAIKYLNLKDNRINIGLNARTLMDGLGSDRIVESILKLCKKLE